MPLQGVYVKEVKSAHGVSYLSFEYNREEVGRMYNRGAYSDVFTMKNGIAVFQKQVFSLKGAVNFIRSEIGLIEPRRTRY